MNDSRLPVGFFHGIVASFAQDKRLGYRQLVGTQAALFPEPPQVSPQPRGPAPYPDNGRRPRGFDAEVFPIQENLSVDPSFRHKGRVIEILAVLARKTLYRPHVGKSHDMVAATRQGHRRIFPEIQPDQPVPTPPKRIVARAKHASLRPESLVPFLRFVTNLEKQVFFQARVQVMVRIMPRLPQNGGECPQKQHHRTPPDTFQCLFPAKRQGSQGQKKQARFRQKQACDVTEKEKIKGRYLVRASQSPSFPAGSSSKSLMVTPV